MSFFSELQREIDGLRKAIAPSVGEILVSQAVMTDDVIKGIWERATVRVPADEVETVVTDFVREMGQIHRWYEVQTVVSEIYAEKGWKLPPETDSSSRNHQWEHFLFSSDEIDADRR